ncbi:hypothetical protein M0Q28_03645 [Patescibacteria group bacterium]|jgi:uncharacterized membrane protein (GlpM family)|nr:hypothetical protein [Patescibacteria group bacterium]
MWNLLKEYAVYFLAGGIVTTVIVAFENSNSRLLSGFATLIPVFTLVAYFFIGESRGGAAVAQHAWLVLIGTIVSWIPYMIAVAILAPKIGSQKAILVGLIIFFILATIYLSLVGRLGFFGAK